ncbi:hypothetical protein, partial [Enterobacter hormaechei]|uniref:hypothetical protein n=1 Tax=Enterobacter hormaechei TaxID=158836 RepID=UPI0031F30E0C
PAYGPQNDVTLKMPAFEWVHVQLHQQKGMISLSPPTICNSAFFFHYDHFSSMLPLQRTKKRKTEKAKRCFVERTFLTSPFPNVSTMLTQLMYQKRWFL